MRPSSGDLVSSTTNVEKHVAYAFFSTQALLAILLFGHPNCHSTEQSHQPKSLGATNMIPRSNITHIGKAIASSDSKGATILPDHLTLTRDFALAVDHNPALRLDRLFVIGTLFPSCSDHGDKLDPLGLPLHGASRIFTTIDNVRAWNRLPRSAALGLGP